MRTKFPEDMPVVVYLALFDMTLRKQPGFDQKLPKCPATTVRDGTLISGQVCEGLDAASYIRIVVITPPEEGSRQVYCFLPLHLPGFPEKEFMRKYEVEMVPEGSKGPYVAASKPDSESSTRVHAAPNLRPPPKGQRRFVVLQDMLLRKQPDFHQTLANCEATTVRQGILVTGEVLCGIDGGQHLKVVIVTPPAEGSRHVFCFLPLHSFEEPDVLLLQPSEAGKQLENEFEP